MHLRTHWLMIFLIGMLCSTVVIAIEYEEDVDYELLTTPLPTANESKIEVVELFWYGCPHCDELEPTIGPWVKKLPGDVEFIRLPAIFKDRKGQPVAAWAILAQAYYTSLVLGVEDKTHSAIFDAIHRHGRSMSTKEQIKALFMQQGVSDQDFERAFNSFAVKSKVSNAIRLTERYQIKGVPALIINGKYRTNAGLTRGNANMLKVIDYLIAQERQAR